MARSLAEGQNQETIDTLVPYEAKQETQELLRKIGEVSMPREVRDALLDFHRTNPEIDYPESIELKKDKEAHAISVRITLQGIMDVKEDDPEKYSQMIQRMRTHLGRNPDTGGEADEEILEEYRTVIRNKIFARISQEDLGGIVLPRSAERVTGVVGYPEGKDLNYTFSQLNKVMEEVSEGMRGVLEELYTDEMQEKNVIIAVSKGTQKAQLNNLAFNSYTVDFPFTKGESMNQLVLVNNAVHHPGKETGGIVVVEATQESEENSNVVVNKAKGTRYKVQRVDPIPEDRITIQEPENPISKAELQFLRTFKIDQFLSTFELQSLAESRSHRILESILTDEQTTLNVGETEFVRTSEDINLEHSVYTKPDISGFSSLSTVMEGELQIPTQLVSYELFGRLVPLAYKCGALIDNFSGDAEDAVVLSTSSLEELGLSMYLQKEWLTFNPAERSIMYSIGARYIFDTLVETWEMDAQEFGPELLGYSPDKITSENLSKCSSDITHLYGLIKDTREPTSEQDILAREHMLNVLRGYTLQIAEVATNKELGLKSVSGHETSTEITFTRVGDQLIQSVKAKNFAQNEHNLETLSKQNSNEITVSAQTFEALSDTSGFKDVFEPVMDEGGNITAYRLPRTNETKLIQRYLKFA